MINFKQTQLLTLLCFLFILLPSIARGECTREPEDKDRNKPLALKYKMAAIASILVAGAIGVCFPLLGKTIKALRPETNLFFITKALAAGVILSTGFIHVLPDATESLTSLCLKFPFAGLVAMASAIATLMVDVSATSHYTKSHSNMTQQIDGDEEKTGEHESHVHVHIHATHGHTHDPASLADGSGISELLRHREVSQEIGGSFGVGDCGALGISLGASESPKTIKPLVAALTFQQFFEGMGLGGCISQAQVKSRSVAIMALFFSLTTPVGIAIGIGISSMYHESSPKALIVEGIFNEASAGILIYMALVDLLAADFMNPKLQNNGMLQVGAVLLFFLVSWL
ncbi:Zinc transporter 5 precursor [Theobroma cacao]|uniref:Zinc transporter 5 n=1 Tax=Theobroma cacao TaxID=3641 RepID=A0A061DMD5_THECC|nr:Zinc transporter 5 precursor [Theobroma cacao]